MSKKSPWHLYAAHMLQGGYSPIPLWPRSKEPVACKRSDKRPEPLVWRGKVNGWDRLRETPLSPNDIAALTARYSQLGIAVVGGFGGLVPVDIDTDDPDVLAVYATAMPRPNVAKKGRRGLVCFYRAAEGGKITGRDFMLPTKGKAARLPIDGTPGTPLVSFLTNRKTVLPPSIHPKTDAPYRWLTKGTLYSKPVINLVPITASHIDALAVALRPWCPPPQPRRYPIVQPGEVVADNRMRSYALSTLRNEAKRLSEMSRDSGRNMRLFGAGCVLGKYVHNKVLAPAEVEAALMDACKANGLVRDDGEQQCRATLTSGLRKASNDGLPALQYWGRSTR